MTKEQKSTRKINSLLRQARIDAGLTQKQLAYKVADELAGENGESTIDDQTVRRWEGLEHLPGPKARQALCKVLHKKSASELGLLWELYHPVPDDEKPDLIQAPTNATQVQEEEDAIEQAVPDTEQEERQLDSPSIPQMQRSPEEEQPVSIPVTPTQRNPLRTIHWLPVAIIICVVLIGVVGVVMIPRFQPANQTPSIDIVATATAETAACAAAPTLVEPVDGQALTSHTVEFTWEAPAGCVPDGYTVRITKSYDHEAKPWIIDTGWAPTFYKYTFPTDGTYYWHIRACKPCTPFNPGRWITRVFTIHAAS